MNAMPTLRPQSTTPPSRDDNPFATCWTRPGALPYLETNGVTVERLLDRWRRLGRVGQVVGPHGVGKSTLLAAAGERLVDDGWQVERLVYRSDRRGPLPLEKDMPETDGRTAFLIDGLEQLGFWRRRRLISRCRRRGVGLIASTHARVPRLPLLAELAPSLPVVLRLHAELTRRRPSPVTPAMTAEVFDRCGGDVRELWFRLYDRHEALACH